MTPEQLADLRKKAEVAQFEHQKWCGTVSRPAWNGGRLHPEVVLSLLDHIEQIQTALDVVTAVAADTNKERDELRAQLAAHQAFDHNPIRDDVSGD